MADLEAAALGCWPIMSDIIQRREVAKSLNIGLYPLTETTSWCSEVSRFLDLSIDDQMRLRREIAARAREAFGLDKMLAGYSKLYNEVVAESE